MWGDYLKEYLDYMEFYKICLELSGCSVKEVCSKNNLRDLLKYKSKLFIIPKEILQESIPIIKKMYDLTWNKLEKAIEIKQKKVLTY